MSTRLMAVALAVAAAAAAVTASTATGAIVNCGTVKAAGKTWHVNAAGVKCATARKVVGQVAAKKPDHVVHAQGGEIDQFLATFSGLRCSKSRQAKVGGAINCSSGDGRRNVIGTYRA